jgi:EAL domain-containing protein (putative c-di-GMP-specific phosphodiesterase class I)
MAASLVGFADSMGWGIIAEGIESEGELCACQEVGVRWGQGFLLGMPGELGQPHPHHHLGATG